MADMASFEARVTKTGALAELDIEVVALATTAAKVVSVEVVQQLVSASIFRQQELLNSPTITQLVVGCPSTKPFIK